MAEPTDPLKIQFGIIETEKDLGALQLELSRAEEAIGAATVKGNQKELERSQLRHLELQTAIRTAQARLLHLNSSLDRAIEDELKARVSSIDETEASLKQEARDAAKEIGSLLAKAEYLIKSYMPQFWDWYRKGPDIWGRKVTETLPPGFEGALYAEAIGRVKDGCEELPGSDPNAESFMSRWHDLHDAKAIRSDPNMARYRLHKRRSVIVRDSRVGG